jgi:DNA adenine methylase
VYIEPFVGTGALLLNLKPERWIINDLNKDLMNVWKLVKSNPERIIKSFKKFQKTVEGKSNKELLDTCKEIVEGFNICKSDTCIFLIMTMISYMGSIIANDRYILTSLNPKIFVTEKIYFLSDAYYTNLLQVSDFLNSTEGKIYNIDCKKVLHKAKEGDFVFLDPPYVEGTSLIITKMKGLTMCL